MLCKPLTKLAFQAVVCQLLLAILRSRITQLKPTGTLFGLTLLLLTVSACLTTLLLNVVVLLSAYMGIVQPLT